jgi:hypothetical protein
MGTAKKWCVYVCIWKNEKQNQLNVISFCRQIGYRRIRVAISKVMEFSLSVSIRTDKDVMKKGNQTQFDSPWILQLYSGVKLKTAFAGRIFLTVQ